METRKITVISNKGQYKKVLETAATTLGELKADMAAVGIDYTGMSFLEGITRTELKDDASQLPTNVNYRGTVTNDLVFYLTVTDKKIKSGMDRREIYDIIDAHEYLKKLIKETFGRNFTQVSNDSLEKIIEENLPSGCTCEECTIEETDLNQVEFLAALLYQKDILTEEEYNMVLHGGHVVLEEEKEAESPYSEKELEDMFDFVED